MDKFSLTAPDGDGPSKKVTQRRSTPLILIFNQDLETRFLYKTLLEMWGYLIEESDDLEDLPKFVKTIQPDLILLDCVSPFFENLEAVHRVRENNVLNRMPIILISGFAQPQFRSLALVGGADDFLVKPIDFESLETRVKNIIQKHIEHTSRTGEVL